MASNQAQLIKASKDGKTIVVSSGDFEGVPVTLSPQRSGDRAPWVTASGERFAPKDVAVQGEEATPEESPTAPTEASEASTEGSQGKPARKPRQGKPEAPTEEATPDTPEEPVSAPVSVPEASEEATASVPEEVSQAQPEASTGDSEDLPLLARLLTKRGVTYRLIRETVAEIPMIRYEINGEALTAREAVEGYLPDAA